MPTRRRAKFGDDVVLEGEGTEAGHLGRKEVVVVAVILPRADGEGALQRAGAAGFVAGSEGESRFTQVDLVAR
jgi:hypothetical protein